MKEIVVIKEIDIWMWSVVITLPASILGWEERRGRKEEEKESFWKRLHSKANCQTIAVTATSSFTNTINHIHTPLLKIWHLQFAINLECQFQNWKYVWKSLIWVSIRAGTLLENTRLVKTRILKSLWVLARKYSNEFKVQTTGLVPEDRVSSITRVYSKYLVVINLRSVDRKQSFVTKKSIFMEVLTYCWRRMSIFSMYQMPDKARSC